MGKPNVRPARGMLKSNQQGIDIVASSSDRWSSRASENTAPSPKRQDMKTMPPLNLQKLRNWPGNSLEMDGPRWHRH